MIFFKKMFHRCKPELVAVNDEYHTTYSDSGKKVYHQMRFYRCECGRKTFEANNNHTHRGIDECKKNWKEAGVVPKNSYHPTENTQYVKIDDLDREELDPVLAYQKTLEDIQKSLKVVLNRDFNLEAKYPKLKEAADEYHRRLDKYRNFENLKEK